MKFVSQPHCRPSKILRGFFLITCTIFALVNTACQTAPKRFDEIPQGQWKARALIRDKAEAKSHIVNLHFNALNGEKVRLDVTSTLGHHLASLVLNGNEVKYMVIQDKKFYQGRPSPDALQPMVAVPLDPRWLYNILFDKPIAEKNWTCTKDPEGIVMDCNQIRGLKISWANRRGVQKTVLVEHAKASVQLNFHDFSTKLLNRKNLFELEPPKNFRVIKLR